MSRILSQGCLATRILIFDYSAPREFPRGWDGVLSCDVFWCASGFPGEMVGGGLGVV